jgi:Uncharacterized protein involved in outer membrane biogenesis
VKAFKILLYLMGLVFALIIAAAIVIPLFLDLNDYKDQIAEVVKKNTGRELAINGNIDLSIFPWLGLKIGPTRLGNIEGFGPEPFASVEDAQIRVKLLPLLRRQVEMDTVVLDGLKLNLKRNKEGRSNWEDLVKRVPGDEPVQAKAPTEAERGGPVLPGLAIGGLKLSNAEILWDDQSSGVNYIIDNINLNSDAFTPETPFPFALNAHLKSREPALDTQLSLAAEGSIAPNLQSYYLKNTSLGLALKGEGLPEQGLELEVRSHIAVDLAQQTLDVQGLELTALDLTLRGAARGNHILDAPNVTAELTLDAFSPRALLAALGQSVPETVDPEVLTKASAELKLVASPEQATLEPLTVKLDETSIQGTASISHFAKPAVRFNVHMDGIDADRYLPPPEAGEQRGAATPAQATVSGTTELPMDTLRSLNVNGTLDVGKLTIFKLHSEDLSLTLGAQNGVVRLNPARARLYEGSYEGSMDFDASGAIPILHLEEQLSSVQAGPLLKDLTGKDRLIGSATVSAKLSGTGITADALRNTLNGNLSFAFADGALNGINIAQIIREARAAFKGEPPPPRDAPNKTDFTELKGTATVTNGVVRNDDLEAKSPLLRVTGSGTVDLAKDQFNYLAQAVIVDTLEGQGGQELAGLKGIPIPIRVEGPLADPSIKPDLAALVREKVEEKIEAEIKKLGDKVEGGEKVEEEIKKLGDKVEDTLRETLGIPQEPSHETSKDKGGNLP